MDEPRYHPDHCNICGCKLLDYPGRSRDPAMNCGGDCHGCIWRTEFAMGCPCFGEWKAMSIIPPRGIKLNEWRGLLRARWRSYRRHAVTDEEIQRAVDLIG